MTAEKRQRRSFPEDFKREAVALVTEQGYKVSEAARSLDIHENVLRKWKQKFEQEDSGEVLSLDEREELKRLKKVERPRIIDAIAEARAHGDLSENAEYHAAREEQGFIEGRIKELDSSLGLAQIIDPTSLDAGGRIVFGATVELFNVATEEEVTYQIVGNLESDIEKSRISISSPIARALIGKEVDDEVDVKTPGGVITYEILSVKYI